MKQLILQKAVVPPGGWRAKCVHCGHRMWAQTHPDFVALVEKHNAANSHPLWDWETQLCESLPPGQCMFEDGSPGVGKLCETRSTDLLAATKAIAGMLIEHALGRDIFVDQGEAERRAAICVRCPKNVPAEGCGGCSAMQNAREAIAGIRGERRTTADQHLNSCCLCGCSIPLIVHLKKSILDRGFTDEQRRLTEATTPWCWKAEAS